MPLPSSQKPSFAFCLTAAEGKSMMPKIQVQLILDLKKFDKKNQIQSYHKSSTHRPFPTDLPPWLVRQ
jgi:hypothetical protein